MLSKLRSGAMAVALVGSSLIGGAVLAKSATVGDLLLGIAKAKHLSAVDAVSARGALIASGVVLPPLALDKVLTEGDVAQIGMAVGLRVTTSDPANPFESGQVEQFMATFGKKLAGGSPDAPLAAEFPNPGTGKGNGKKKGHHKSPTDPE